MATGVLPVFIGKATRLIEYRAASGGSSAKAYSCVMKLGLETETADIWGAVIGTSDAPMPSDERIREAVSGFVGVQVQVPPMYSAIKVNGKKLYEYARAGQELPMDIVKSRKIAIESIEVSSIDRENKEIAIDVVCSKGTYIRTLCSDIGNVFGTFATMTQLRRTMSDGFSLEGSVSVDFLKSLPRATSEAAEIPGLSLIPMDRAVSHLEKVMLTEHEAALFCNGIKVEKYGNAEGLVSVYEGDKFLGVAKYDGNVLKAEKVIR
jgi:tRNA pseudouridine55 synthase